MRIKGLERKVIHGVAWNVERDSSLAVVALSHDNI